MTGGYEEKQGEPYIEGWYRVDVKNKYDIQTSGYTKPERGLLVETKDVFDNQSEIIYDNYGLLPVEARKYYDSSNYLATLATYDYRLLKPYMITDENENRSVFAYSPLGLLKNIGLIGQQGENQGDIIQENPLEYVPSTVFSYDLMAFADEEQPVWVETTQREKHWQQDPSLNSPTIKKIEYSDGFGRILQARVQAEKVIFGESTNGLSTGNSGLPISQSSNGDAVGKENIRTDKINVVVSGRKRYNNKGKEVEQFEPYFDAGFEFNLNHSALRLQKTEIYYDAGGRPVKTVNPDGSEQRVVYGTPKNIGNPEDFTPNPWERYTYDANDMGWKTHPTESGSYRQHWNTPKSETVDQLGRTVKTTEHNSQPNYASLTRYICSDTKLSHRSHWLNLNL